MLFQANPFPECDCEAQAIIQMAFAGFSILFLIVLMVIMFYFYTKIKKLLPIIAVFLFSLIIGLYSLSSMAFPFTPWFQLFFILNQTIFLYLSIEGGMRF